MHHANGNYFYLFQTFHNELQDEYMQGFQKTVEPTYHLRANITCTME